jgi:hypothetical protein
MKEFADLRQLLLAYRLGELSVNDREQLDERLIGDQDFSDRIAEAEYDLIDDYRTGRLTPVERRRVEKAFSSMELQPASARSSDTSKAPAPLSVRWLPLGAASMTCVLAALLLAIYFYKTQSLSPVAVSHPTQQPQQPAPSVTAVSPSTSGSAQVKPGAGHSLAVLLLQPVVRGAVAPVLKLWPATQTVRVQWVVPEGAAAQSFTLSVTRKGTILGTIAQKAPLRRIGNSLVAEFDLPPAVFAKAPQNAQFLFVVSTGDASRTAMGEYPVMVCAQR